MTNLARIDGDGQVAARLIALLHQNAPAEDFALRLAEVEQLPDDCPGKSMLVETVRRAMAVRNRLELQQQRELGMLAVIESAHDLSRHLDTTGLLKTIVSRARQLLGADVGWLSILDSGRAEFRVLVADGALSEATGGMVAHRDHGVVSVVMTTRLPFTTPDYLHDKRFAHDAGLDDTFRHEGIGALVGVPLIVEGEVIGLLFVGDRYHRVHTAQNIAILCTLATHAALALKNAHDFERLNGALARADDARAALERHLRGIQAAADAHEQMTSLLARGASLATLCQAVATQLDGGLLVLDEAAQVISRGTAPGYPGAGAQAYEPHGARSAELGRALRESRRIGRSVIAWEGEGETCRVMPVIGGDDVLGAIALFHRGTLEDVTIRTFERSSNVIGIVLLSQERMEASRHRDAASLLRALVSPRQDEPAVLANRAERYGLDLSQPLVLMLLDVDGPSAGFAARRLRHAIPAGTSPRALIDDVEGQLLTLCAATQAEPLRRQIAQWADRELGSGYRGVQSRPAGGPTALPELHATLRRGLRVLERIGVRGRILAQNELALYSTLFETHDQRSLASFLQATIGPLLAYDERRGTELAPTLLGYLENQQNAKVTAQQLAIHVNTVRQRLATIEELLGPWQDAAQALEIHVALRLWRLGVATA